MKITYLKHREINKKKWDQCIDRSPDRIIYAQSWYLDHVSSGWEALVADDYEAVMPLTYGKKYGIQYLFQPFFTQQLGVFSSEEPDHLLVEAFLNAIPSRFKFIDIALNKGNNIHLPAFQTKSNVNYELKLNQAYSDLKSKYSSNTKRNLKKAKKNNLFIETRVQPQEIINLFNSNLGKKIHKIKEKHYDQLQQVMEESLHKGNAEIYGAYSSNGRLCAGAFFLNSYNNYIFLFSATNEESKEKGAMFLIIDLFIQKHSESDSVLDFEGSNIKSLARFYSGFGSYENSYLRIKKNNLPWLLKIFKQ